MSDKTPSTKVRAERMVYASSASARGIVAAAYLDQEKEIKSLRQANTALALQNKEMRDGGQKLLDALEKMSCFCNPHPSERTVCPRCEALLSYNGKDFSLPDISTEIVDRFEKRVETKVYRKSAIIAYGMRDGQSISNVLNELAQASDQEAGDGN